MTLFVIAFENDTYLSLSSHRLLTPSLSQIRNMEEMAVYEIGLPDKEMLSFWELDPH